MTTNRSDDMSSSEQTEGTQPGRAAAKRGVLAPAAAVGAAFLASACCIGPLLFVTLGVGAGLAARMEPVRPLFVALTVGLLGLGFYTVYGRPVAGEIEAASCAQPGERCEIPRSRTRDKAILWTATLIALIVLTFPQWSLLLT